MTNLKSLAYAKPRLIGLHTLYSYPIDFPVINNETFSAILNLSSLKRIIITNGVINQLDLSAVSGIRSLCYLDLYNNKLASIISSSQILRNNTASVNKDKMKCYEFYTLALSNNLLRSINKSQLVHDKVTRLDLSVNLISYAERNVFENMPCLEFIDL